MLFSLLNVPPASASTAAGSGGAGAPGAGAGLAAAGVPAAARVPKRRPHVLREGAARALFGTAAALSIAAVALNTSDEEKRGFVRLHGKLAEAVFPEHSISTLLIGGEEA